MNNFKNNLQALTDKSKLLGTAPSKIQDSLRLPKVYQLHAGLHERVLTLTQALSNDLNNDYGAVFQEKKYKELMVFARE